MEEIIKKLNIPILLDQIQGDSDVYLVRHAFSEFNYRDMTKKERGESFKSLKSDPTLCDPNIHEIGLL